MQHAGGREIIDIEKLRRDKVISRMLGYCPSDSALADWHKRYGVGPVDGVSSGKMERMIRDGYLIVAKRTIDSLIERGEMTKEVTLDVDATVIYADKREAKYTYKGRKGFTPMLAFLDDIPFCVNHEFREGNVPPGGRALSFLKSSEEKIERLGLRLKYLRSDSAWYKSDVFNRCEERGIKFVIGARKNRSVMEKITEMREEEF